MAFIEKSAGDENRLISKERPINRVHSQDGAANISSFVDGTVDGNFTLLNITLYLLRNF